QCRIMPSFPERPGSGVGTVRDAENSSISAWVALRVSEYQRSSSQLVFGFAIVIAPKNLLSGLAPALRPCGEHSLAGERHYSICRDHYTGRGRKAMQCTS